MPPSSATSSRSACSRVAGCRRQRRFCRASCPATSARSRRAPAATGASTRPRAGCSPISCCGAMQRATTASPCCSRPTSPNRSRSGFACMSCARRSPSPTCPAQRSASASAVRRGGRDRARVSKSVPALLEARHAGAATLLGLPGQRFVLLAPASDAESVRARFTRSRHAGRLRRLALAHDPAGMPVITAATQDAFVAQAANLDILGGIDFQKGCYTGSGNHRPRRNTWAGSRSGRYLFHIDTRGRRGRRQDLQFRPSRDSPAAPSSMRRRPPAAAAIFSPWCRSRQLNAAMRAFVRRDGPRLAALPLPYAIPAPSAPRGRASSLNTEASPCGARTQRASMSTTGSPPIRPRARERIGALLADIEARTGVRGNAPRAKRRSRRPGWRPTPRSRAPRRSGASSPRCAQEHEAAALTTDGERHVEAFAPLPSLPARRRQGVISVRPTRAMCLALIAFAAHPALPCGRRRQPRRVSRASGGAASHGGTRASSPDAISRRAARGSASTARGRVALLTNVREPVAPRSCARRRAARCVPNAARRRRAALGVAAGAGSCRRCRYNGFNLIAGDSASSCGARTARPRRVSARPRDLWRVESPAGHAVAQGGSARRKRFRRWCKAMPRGRSCRAPSRFLRDTERAPDDELPATGVTLERERMLSSPFIISAGLRHALLDRPRPIDHDGNAQLHRAQLSTRRETPPARSNSASRRAPASVRQRAWPRGRSR